ncbi:creatinase/Prolidase N-terminal domain protein, partial [Acinetobacter pittii]|uniref:aminopeptidase P family N-terminal domain-containing protein n=2 Tax=Acinetobacter calcoaceticus/baumannii complex TaxID=909768 RepID=UPI0004A0827E
MNTLVNNFVASQLPSLLTIENGEKVSATFSLSEYQNRQSKLRQLMEELEIDHVLFSSIHNINYYADFIYCSFGRFYGLVVSPEKVVTISANIDAGQPWRRTIGDYNVVYTDWQRDNYFKAVTQEIPNKGRVGIEFDHLPLERLNKLKAVLPNVQFVDISAACMKLRMIKSAEEIAHITQ